ncbi:MAG TPA: 50S ribosomal protein L32 [Candidatus Cloacimonadota bacterium]|nr:50S ribosomal protein L32 [Candidatus Cloacimonadota bacterium]HQL15178.1 50S ribosomal protein L32 [Candidatus Cloacimonadota bacterium]
MAVPKKRTSKARRDKRRTHDNAPLPAVSKCGHCGEPCLPHHVCPKCGYYDGKQVIAKKD